MGGSSDARVRRGGEQYRAVSAVPVRMRRRPVAASHDDRQGQSGCRGRTDRRGIAQAAAGQPDYSGRGAPAISSPRPRRSSRPGRARNGSSCLRELDVPVEGVVPGRRSVARTDRRGPTRWWPKSTTRNAARTTQIGIPIRFSKSPGRDQRPGAARRASIPTKSWPDWRRNRRSGSQAQAAIAKRDLALSAGGYHGDRFRRVPRRSVRSDAAGRPRREGHQGGAAGRRSDALSRASPFWRVSAASWTSRWISSRRRGSRSSIGW